MQRTKTNGRFLPIAVQARTLNTDEYGAVSKTWTTLKTIYGQIKPDMSKQRLVADKPNSDNYVKIYTRFDSALTTSMRLSHGTTYYGIDSIIDPTGERLELTIYAHTLADGAEV